MLGRGTSDGLRGVRGRTRDVGDTREQVHAVVHVIDWVYVDESIFAKLRFLSIQRQSAVRQTHSALALNLKVQ